MIIVTFKGSGAAVQKACGRSRALKRVQEGHTESTENTEMVGSPAARNLTNLVQILQNYI